MKDSLSIIISNNLRSLEYLRVFINLKKNPNKIIYINDNKNSIIANKIKNTIKDKKFKKKIFNSNKFSSFIMKFLLREKEKNYVLSLPHGEIIRNKNLLKKKKFNTFPPGQITSFQGSNFYLL